MKIFTASLCAETNTFSVIPTGLASFEECGLYRGDGSLKDPDGTGVYVSHVRWLAEADGHDVSESIAAFAQPGGPTVQKVYESLRDAILTDLASAMPIDVVQLFLHGAMVAEDEDDCEGDLLERIRALVGPDVPVGAVLDLHCHFTERMRRSADALVSFKEYPHIDAAERAAELYNILMGAARGEVRPVTAMFDCGMVGLYHTTREPMAGFVRRMQSVEGRGGILSVSLGHGFPWGDVADNGTRLWVIADGLPDLAQETARALGEEFRALRDENRIALLGVDDAIDLAEAEADAGGPILLSDMADNPGGGAPGDSTFLLGRIVERGIRNVAVGAIWDPGAIQICRMAGPGAHIALRVGGKCGTVSSDPVDLNVRVHAFAEHHSQRTFSGRTLLGPSCWVETPEGVHLLIVSTRSQITGQDAFSSLGMTLTDKRIIILKSAHHFVADFGPIAKAIHYVSSPGAVDPQFERIAFRKRPLTYWPRVSSARDSDSR